MGLEWIKRKKVAEHWHASLSAPDCGCSVTSCLCSCHHAPWLWVQCDQLPLLLPPCLPHRNEPYSPKMSQNKSSDPYVNLVRHFVKAARKITNTPEVNPHFPEEPWVPTTLGTAGRSKGRWYFQISLKQDLLKVEQTAKACDAFLGDWLSTFITLRTHAQSKNMALFCVSSCAGSTSTKDWPQALHFPRSCMFWMHGRSGLGSNYSLIISLVYCTPVYSSALLIQNVWEHELVPW